MSNTMHDIVLVDDNATFHEFFQYAVEQLDSDLQASIKLQSFLSADAAMPYFETQSPSMLFMDIIIHGKDGFSMLRDLRKMVPYEKLPVIVISTKDYEQDKAMARDLGVLDFIVKPMPARLLTDMIKKHIDSH